MAVSLSDETRAALQRISTATITLQLLKRGVRLAVAGQHVVRTPADVPGFCELRIRALRVFDSLHFGLPSKGGGCYLR